MKTLSLKLEESILKETEIIVARLNKSRNRYINEAVDYYNHLNTRKMIAYKLKSESELVREESLSVMSEFENLRDED